MKTEYADAFGKAAIATIKSMCSTDFSSRGEVEKIAGVNRTESGLVVSLPFYGQITGHYLMILNDECAKRLYAKTNSIDDQEVLYSFLSELLNTAVGEAVLPLIKDYEELSVFSPMINACPVRYPEVDGLKLSLTAEDSSEIDLYVLLEHKKSARLINSGEDLQDAVKQVYDATEIRSQFLGILSHELRTPLNSIIGLTDILLSEIMNKEHLDILSKLKDSGLRMQQIIESVYDYIQIKTDQTKTEKVPFDLENEVFSILEDFRPEAQRKSIEIVTDISSTVSQVTGDLKNIKKTLHSLISNAVKFTEKGQVIIRIKPRNNNGRTQDLTFSIEDTGIGIAPEQREVVLKPFEQMDMSSARCFDGIGLGLTISNSLINILGGKLNIDSELNKGTKVTFELTLDISEPGQPVQQVFKNKNAIIIDSGTNEALEKYLIHFGFNYKKFVSLTEFLQKNTEKFDVIYLAIRDELSFKSAQVFSRNKIAAKVINLLSSPDSEFKNKLITTGFKNFICNPVLPKDVLTVTQRVITGTNPPAVSETKRARFNVLIAEDNVVNQLVIKKVFNLLGHDTVIANDGQQVLDMIQQQHFDIVFMDIHMPVIDGLDATRQIRMKSQFNNIPIIALTASSEENVKEKCLAVGMNGFIQKPFKLDKIKKLLSICAEQLSKKQESCK